MSINKYYPKLSTILHVNAIPEELGFIANGLHQLLDGIFVKEVQMVKSNMGEAVSYYLVLIIFKEVGVDIPGTGFRLLINPGEAALNGSTEIPVSVNIEVEILRYASSFNLDAFAASPLAFFNLIMEILDLEESELLKELISVFTNNNISALVTQLNQANGLVGTLHEIQVPSNANQAIAIAELAEDLIDKAESMATSFGSLLFSILEDVQSLERSFKNVNDLFRFKMGTDPIERVRQLFIPKVNASLDISAAVEFPRKVLIPIKADGTLETNDTILQRVEFDPGAFVFSTEGGIGFNKTLHATFPLDYPKAQIGNTGLTIGFINASLDISRETNIPEADADGRPKDFIGVFVEDASIGLPEKWFRQESGTTAEIFAENFILGTGGASGLVGIRPSSSNPPPGGQDPVLLFTLGAKAASGGDPARPGFQIGFKKFEMEFKQNAIMNSTIEGFLIIPGFEDVAGNPAEIEITLSFQEDGDFKIVAKESTGIPIRIPNVFELIVTQLAIGKEDGRFFLSILGSFTIINTNLSTAFKNPIEIKKLIVWDDGQVEFAGGGTVVLPKPASLKLGPAELSVTALHFGSHEQFHIDQVRKYLYFGLDAQLNVNPGGVDAKGDGIKLYFTVDNGTGKPPHIFIRIEGIRIDLIIPGNATPEKAALLLSGWLSMKDTPNGRAYVGGVEFSLPKPQISGHAAMSLNPKVPSFLIDVGLELPTPIALGPSGLGIYGMRGLIGQKMVVDQAAAGVPVEPNWYPYYKAKVAPEYREGVQASKFAQKDGFSLGAGLSIATIDPQPKKAFTSKVFFLLSLPDVFLIQGQMAVVKERLGLDTVNDPPFSFMLAITNESITVGAGASYKMKEDSKILEIDAQIEMAFFFKNANAWYIHLGTDVNPIRGLILKDAISFDVYAYLMINGSGIKAGAGISFNKSYKLAGGVLSAELSAYFDTFAKINFKPRQFGGAIQIGGRVALRAFGIGITISAALSMAAEVSKPFFITGNLEVCIEINLWIKKFDVCGNIEFTWIFDRNPNTEEIPLLEGGDKSGKARHMVTGEPLSLYHTTSNSSTLPAASAILNGNYVIALDSYLEFEFKKPIRAGAGVKKIGGPNGGGNTDKIPQIKGKLEQVAHEFIVDEINLFCLNAANNWEPYDIYDALSPLANTGIGVSLPAPANRRNGFWQVTSGGSKVNRLTIMAQSPLEWTRQGNTPMVIEDFGITASDLFCPPQAITKICLTFDDYHNNPVKKDALQFHDGTLFRMIGEDGLVADIPNPFGTTKALCLPKGSSLEILFIEPTACVELFLMGCTDTLSIRYEKKVRLVENDLNGIPQYGYALCEERLLGPANLVTPVIFEDANQAIDRVLIFPGDCQNEDAQNCEDLTLEAQAFELLLNELAVQNELLTVSPTDMNTPPYENFYSPHLAAYHQAPHQYLNVVNPDQALTSVLISHIGRLAFHPCEIRLAFTNPNPDLLFNQITGFSNLQADPSSTANANEFTIIAKMVNGTREKMKGSTSCYPLSVISNTSQPNETCRNITALVSNLETQQEILISEITTLETICNESQAKPCSDLSQMVCHELEIKRQELEVLHQQIINYTTYQDTYCDPNDPTIPNPVECNCQTYLFKACWLTKEQLDQNNNLVPYANLVQDTQAMIEAINLSLKPVFRPDMVYLIQLKVRDQMSQASSGDYTRYHNYGFRTMGAVGHFHPYRPEYAQLQALDREDEFILAKLKPYIDFEKSFPNADGRLTNAKPLFYDCPKLLLFFIHPHVYTMFQSFDSYCGQPAVSNSLDVLIKDPIEPYAAELPSLNWKVTSFAREERDVQILNNFLNGQDCVQVTNLNAQGMSLEIEACNLKPLKLYTALYQSTFKGDVRDVHSYPFVTSRYACFKEQIESYLIKDESGQTVRKAFFDYEKAFDTANEITPAMAIVNETMADTDPLRQEFMHVFDRLVDGALGLGAIHPPERTDFIMVRDTNPSNPSFGNVIGLLARNIEPFNDPKLEGIDLEDTIRVLDTGGNIDTNYTVVFSKDGTKAFITNAAFNITAATLNIRFRFLLWDGQSYFLTNPLKDEVTVSVDVFAPTTQLIATHCGITNIRVDSEIEADPIPSAIAYEFLVENSIIGYKDTYLRKNEDARFPLFELFGLRYGHTYQVSVRPVIIGRITTFGPSCPVTIDLLSFTILPPSPSTQGVTAKVDIEVHDSNGQLVPDFNENVRLIADNNATVHNNGLVEITNGKGSIWVKDKVAETVTLSLVDSEGTGQIVGSSQSLTFGIAPANEFVITDLLDNYVGLGIPVPVKAINQFGLVDTNYYGHVHLQSTGDAVLANGGLVNLINGIGQLTISNQTAETVTLSLIDTNATGFKIVSTQELTFRAVGIIFRDTFSVNQDTSLTSHAPDLGASWPLLLQTNGGLLKANHPNGFLVRETGGNGKGALYIADSGLTNDQENYAIEARQVSGRMANISSMLAVRIQDINNMYAVRFNESTSQLFKRFAGTWSPISSAGPGPVNGSIVKLQVIDNALKFFENHTELLFALDADLPTAGWAGIGMGAIIIPSDRLWNQQLDNVRVCLADGASTLFLDTFTDNSLLENRNPDIGDTWTQVINTGSSGGIKLNGKASKSGSGVNTATGSFYTANIIGGYTSLNYEIALRVLNPETADKTISLGLRVQNNGQDGYFVRFNGDACRLYIRTAGVWSLIGNAGAGVSANAIVRFEIKVHELSFFIDEKLVLQETVTIHNTAGEGGLGMGAVMEGLDKEGQQEVDDFVLRFVV